MCPQHFEASPARKAYKRAYGKKYYADPVVAKRQAEYQRTPEFKEGRREYRQRSEVKERMRDYRKTPKYNKWLSVYQKTEAYKGPRKIYASTPEQREKRNAYQKTIKGLYASSQVAARRKSLPWNISLEEFTTLRDNACAYCQFALPPTGSGLDRINNAAGYTLLNVVPCCASCNLTRGDRYTHEEMLHEIGPVLRKVKLARSPPLPYTPETSPSIEVSNVQRD